MNAEIAFLQMSGLLAAEIAAVVLITLLSERFVPSAHWRRTAWQVCVLSLLLVATLELTGVGRAGAEWFRRPPARNDMPSTANTMPVESVPLSSVEPVFLAPRVTVTSRPVHGTWRQAVFPLACMWILGTALLLFRIVVSRTMLLVMSRSAKRVRSGPLLLIVQDLAPRLGIYGSVRIIEFPRLKAPVAFGLTPKTIGLPPGFQSHYSQPQQEVILAHELAHLAARDSSWLLLAEVAVAALWWHPFAWLARRRLQYTSETAADESSLLVQNGPPLLAECLLEVGKQLEVKSGFGWLSIDGFRSGLGRRVQHLFELPDGNWKPARKIHTTLAKALFPVAIVLAAILCSGWISPAAAMKGTEMKTPIWKRSMPAFALLAFLGAEQQAAPAEKPTTKTVSPPAEIKTTSAHKGKGSAAIRRKLEQTVFPSVHYDNLPLGEVIRILNVESEKRDPEGVGVNFLLHQFYTEIAAIDPATGLPMSSEAVDLSAVTVRIIPPIRNVRLIDVLDAIMKMTDRPLRYSIEEYGVLITLANRHQPATLETRTFVVNPPDIFFRGIESAFGIDVPDSPAAGARSREAQQRIFEELFLHLGLDWAPPKSIFYNEVTGIVMVRAPQEDMVLISATIQTLGGSPNADPNPTTATTVRK